MEAYYCELDFLLPTAFSLKFLVIFLADCGIIEDLICGLVDVIINVPVRYSLIIYLKYANTCNS